MTKIKKYTKKDGSTAYMFNAYIGIDPLTGKPKRTTRRGFKKPKEARLALARITAGLDSPKIKVPNEKKISTFQDVYDSWSFQYINTVKEVTYERTTTIFDKHILPNFGKRNIQEIDIAFCQKNVNAWSQKLVNFSTVKSYVQKVLDYAISQKIINENPMRLVIMPRRKQLVDEYESKNYFDLDELKSFLDLIKQNYSEQDYLFFRMLAFTGMRKGEAMALCWNDVDFKNGMLSINKTLTVVNNETTISPPKTKASKRHISLDPKTITDLRTWKLSQKKIFLKLGIRVNDDTQQKIFTNDANGFMYPSRPNVILKENGFCNITPHGFRHTHASLLFEADASVKEVQERLGHTNISTTMNIYAHVTKTKKEETAIKFANYVNF